jgi:ATP-dependent DNA helicase RecG
VAKKPIPEQLAFDFESVPPPKSELRDLWTPDDILADSVKNGASILTQFGEDNRVEWKSAKYPARDLADYLSMWANTQPFGGLIAIGIEKDGTISGCNAVGLAKVSEFESACSEQCPDAQFDIRRIPARTEYGEDDFVVLMRVRYRVDKLVETIRHEAFIRVGNTKRRLSEDEKQEIRINKGQIEYEKELVNLRYPDDFDDLLIEEFCRQYREKRGLKTHQTREQIVRLNHPGSVVEGKFAANLACSLIFALDPRSVIPGARIRFLRYEGTEELTGQDYNVVKDVFVDGSLPRMIKEIEEVVNSKIRNFTKLGRDGKFYTRPEYPGDVWREAVVNACVHRSYNLRNMNIFIKMFDNRFTVESPGGFPPPVTATTVYEHHNPRNPHLMNAMFYFDYVKCSHEGTNRMREDMLSANLPEPEFLQKEVSVHQVHVTLRNNVEARKEFVDASALKLIGEQVYAQLSNDEKNVINYIAEKGLINVRDTNRLLHKDWQASKAILQGLTDRTILMRRSKSEKARSSAHYVLRRPDAGVQPPARNVRSKSKSKLKEDNV